MDIIPMKQVQVRVPANQSDIIEDMLKILNIKSRATSIVTRDNDILFQIRVEDSESNELIHELKARGVGDIFGEVNVMMLSLHMSSASEISKIDKSNAANIEEILSEIQASATLNGSYIALIILSGALAALGLLGDSTVIIIGSMIVAPLLAPVALTSIGILLTQRNILIRGLISEVVGVILTIFVGFIVGELVIQFSDSNTIVETEAMKERALQADPLNILFAVVSGIAAGVIISKGQGLSIVGVAIAASLAPPAANIGLYLALNNPYAALIAATILMINIFAINTSCSLIFTIYKLPSKAGLSKRRSSRARRINNLITLLIFTAFVGLSIYFTSIVLNN
ncbi:MAG: TIGR00341 family protein [Candidatus Kariarchaeum pelagius]